MKKLVLSVLFLVAAALGAQAKIDRPKVVVGLVVDQMRWDYLYYYYDKFGEGGLKRLVDEGFSCENTMIPYLPTVTAIGHTSIYTGSVPALHGIAGNNFILDGKEVYCCSDATVQGVGSNTDNAQMSPRNLLATTIGDQLKLATDFRSRVFGVALKDRAAILPAGHSADAAYWWDSKVGHFVSSTYYMKELPKWVQAFNKENNTKPGFDIKTSTLGVTMTFKMAEALLDNEKIGEGEETDFLAVSVSSTDAIGHAFGTRGKENYEVYMQLDKDLAHFLNKLDEKYGRGNYLLFLSADHGGAHNPYFLNEHKIPGGALNVSAIRKAVDKHVCQTLGVSTPLITENTDYALWIDRKAVAAAGQTYEKVKQVALEYLRQDTRFAYVVDCDNVMNETVAQPIRERIANGYNRFRSGSLLLVPQPEVFWVKEDPKFRGTNHGEWNPYDAHIPAVFFGWKVRHGATSTPVKMTDIAPTVCQLLHIQMPNACVGNAIPEVVTPR